MPIEIRRFGVGHRRPDRPAGTSGVTGQATHSADRAGTSDPAFARGAQMEPHAVPNTTWLIVIEGGGWVGVGDERTRVAAGEAVLWPADIPHGAWTEHSEMRAFVIEFADADDAAMKQIVEGRARELEPGSATAAHGALRPAADRRGSSDPNAGEPA